MTRAKGNRSVEDFLTTQRGRQIARQASMRRARGAGGRRSGKSSQSFREENAAAAPTIETRSRAGFAPSPRDITLQRAGPFPRAGRVYASERLFGLRFRRHPRALREQPPRFQRPSKTRPLSVMVTAAAELLTGSQRTRAAASFFFSGRTSPRPPLERNRVSPGTLILGGTRKLRGRL